MNIKYLFYLALTALLIIIWIDFIPFKFEELSEGAGVKFENLIHRICLAYITSFIFYYVVVYMKDRKNKKNIYPLVAHWSRFIALNNLRVLHNMLKASKYSPKSKYPSLEEFKIITKEINIFDIVPDSLNLKWIDFLKNQNKHSSKYITNILNKTNYLDSEHVRIITSLQNSIHLSDIAIYNKEEVKENHNLEGLHKVFFNYYQGIKALDQFNEKYYKEYYNKYYENLY